ncbi:uncharacterized protein METZ01_LOCUS431861, partial [marine metagenome]
MTAEPTGSVNAAIAARLLAALVSSDPGLGKLLAFSDLTGCHFIGKCGLCLLGGFVAGLGGESKPFGSLNEIGLTGFAEGEHHAQCSLALGMAP